MARWSSFCLGLLVVAALGGPARAARAQDEPGAPPAPQGERAAPLSHEEQLKKRASEHFERGVTLFRDGAYRAALIEFERAYGTVPDYRLLYNQAQMRMLLQDYLGATRDYERYLSEGGERVPAERRSLVEHELAILKSRVARITVRTDRAGARLYIDDTFVGETPIARALPLNVGRHRIQAEAADGASAAKVVDLAGGELLEVSLELRAPKVKTLVMREEVPVPTRGSSFTPWAVTTTITAGALTAGALGLGLSARSAERDLEDEVREIPARKQRIESARDRARRLSIGTDVLSGAALASAVAAVVLWAVAARSPEDESAGVQVSARIGPRTLGIVGRF